MITREEYMANPEITHQEYYSQFVTEASRNFVLQNIGIDLLLKSECKHFNDITPVPNSSTLWGWIWTGTPIPVERMRANGETNVDTPSVHVTIGKVTARLLVNEYNQRGTQ